MKTTEEVDGYWVFEGTPSPCESVNVKLPMPTNEGSGAKEDDGPHIEEVD